MEPSFFAVSAISNYSWHFLAAADKGIVVMIFLKILNTKVSLERAQRNTMKPMGSTGELTDIKSEQKARHL